MICFGTLSQNNNKVHFVPKLESYKYLLHTIFPQFEHIAHHVYANLSCLEKIWCRRLSFLAVE